MRQTYSKRYDFFDRFRSGGAFAEGEEGRGGRGDPRAPKFWHDIDCFFASYILIHYRVHDTLFDSMQNVYVFVRSRRNIVFDAT